MVDMLIWILYLIYDFWMCEQLHSALTERLGHISNPLTIKNVKKLFYNTSVLGLIGLYIFINTDMEYLYV